MKKLIVFAVIVTACILLPACATVKVYSDAGLKNETGVRYYTLKPYLLVEYLAEKDNTVKTTVVYLPDLSNPQFMVVRAGLGSSEMEASFTNSAIASIGVVTDSQLPESMAAFADILSKSAYAAQTFTHGGQPEEDSVNQPTPFRLYEIIFSPAGTTLKEVLL